MSYLNIAIVQTSFNMDKCRVLILNNNEIVSTLNSRHSATIGYLYQHGTPILKDAKRVYGREL